MREIRILDKSYQVPSFARDLFSGLQDRLKIYQKEIARLSGRRRAVSVQHWLLVMDGVIGSYEEAMKELKEDIGLYTEFFRALSLDVREAFRRKAAELAEMERERERLACRAREQSDEELYLSLDVERKQKLQDMTLNLMRATALILRKIQVSWTALSRLAADKSLQEEVLGQLSSQLRLYRDVLRFDRRMNQLQYEVSRFAQIAVRFDHIIAENIGPLHVLIGEVAKVDEHIARSLNEMERLSFELSAQAGGAQVALGSALEAVLRHLVLSRVNQGIFDDAIRLMAQEDSAAEELEYRTLESEDDLLASIGSASRLVERQVALLLGAEGEKLGAASLSTGAAERLAAGEAGTAGGIRRLRVDLNTVLVTSGLLSAAPCLHERSLYIGDEGGSFYRLEADTGSVRWRALLPAGINAAAAVYEGLCLVGLRNGQVFCLDCGSGERRWTFQTSGRIEAAPVVRAGRAFIGSLDGIMYCLEVESGSLRWQFAAGSAIAWEAALGEAVVYFAGSAEMLFGVGSESGEQVLALRAGTSVVGAPVVAAGKLVFAGGDGRLYAFRADSGEPAWTLGGRDERLLPPAVFSELSSGQEELAVQSSEGQLCIVSAAEGEIVSTMSTGARNPTFPPFIRGFIACLQREPGTLEMMDLRAGRLLWSSEVSESPLLRPALSQDYLVAADRMGRIYLGAYGPLEPVVE